jgi:hypothetical protein
LTTTREGWQPARSAQAVAIERAKTDKLAEAFGIAETRWPWFNLALSAHAWAIDLPLYRILNRHDRVRIVSWFREVSKASARLAAVLQKRPPRLGDQMLTQRLLEPITLHAVGAAHLDFGPPRFQVVADETQSMPVGSDRPRTVQVIDEIGISAVLGEGAAWLADEASQLASVAGRSIKRQEPRWRRDAIIRFTLATYEQFTGKKASGGLNSDAVAFCEAVLELLGQDPVGTKSAVDRQLGRRITAKPQRSSRTRKKKNRS